MLIRKLITVTSPQLRWLQREAKRCKKPANAVIRDLIDRAAKR